MAFQFYHRSISSAPVNSPEYALALANRSALFYTLKNYKVFQHLALHNIFAL